MGPVKAYSMWSLPVYGLDGARGFGAGGLLLAVALGADQIFHTASPSWNVELSSWGGSVRRDAVSSAGRRGD